MHIAERHSHKRCGNTLAGDLNGPGIGAAATRGDVPVFQDESGIVAGGVGGRFLFRPQDSLWVGIDVAKGPEESALYIVMGHKW